MFIHLIEHATNYKTQTQNKEQIGVMTIGSVFIIFGVTKLRRDPIRDIAVEWQETEDYSLETNE